MPRCGPPQACSARFSLATVRSPGFGSLLDDSSPFRTRFRSGSACPWLSLAAQAHSSAHSTKGTPSLVPLAGASSDRPEAHGFRIYFTPLTGVLFTVPSRYWSTIGRRLYLALGRGRPRFPPPVTWTAVLTVRAHTRLPAVAYRTLTLCGDPFQRSSADQKASSARRLPPPPARPFNPAQASPAGCAARTVWALPRSLAATGGIFSFPRGTEMFQFPRYPLTRSPR